MERAIRLRFYLMSGMIIAAVIVRFIPHPPNFTPIAAMALFAGAHFDRRALAFVVPLAAMLLSDALLEALFGWGFHANLPAVYISFAAIVGLGLLLRGRAKPAPVVGAALTASTLFFIVTNLSVWVTSPVFPKTVSGLVACYVAALPFFGNTLAGDLFYTGVLFGAFALARHRFTALRRSRLAGA
jgi:hypothetical protein